MYLPTALVSQLRLDYVRLRDGYAPPHWKRQAGDSWDSGYERTGFSFSTCRIIFTSSHPWTGYFLDWIEDRYGDGTIREINLALKETDYDVEIFREATGRSVKKLWRKYRDALAPSEVAPAPPAEPTHSAVDETSDWEEI